MFDYEICLFPPAQAESVDYLNELQKATFAEAIWNNVTKKDVTIPRQVQYVIDGGALLHRIPWSRGATFAHILDSYGDYVVTSHPRAICGQQYPLSCFVCW